MFDTFLTHFNTIDKQLDVIVGSGKFLPYNEKLNTIAHGSYALSPWIRHHIDQLKYFGEIRNMIIHHQGNQREYVQISENAINDIATLAEIVTRPPSVQTYAHQPVLVCRESDLLSEVIQSNSHRYNSIPVIDKHGAVIGGLESDHLTQRMGTQTQIDMQTLRVGDLPLIKPHHYHQINSSVDVFEAIHMFADRGDIYALLVIEDNIIQGIITRHDVPSIVEKVL